MTQTYNPPVIINDKISTARKTGVLLDHIFGGSTKPKKGERRAVPVRINGVVYGSMSIAARSLRLKFSTVNNRVISKDSKWVNWVILNKPIKLS